MKYCRSQGGDIQRIYNVIDELIKYNPPFIDVTSHSSQVHYEETPQVIKKKVKRKRPGTIGIRTNFCIGVGGYPEKHFEVPNLNSDIKRVKEKVMPALITIVSQMFYNNKHFLDFVKKCLEEKINVPIIPGLKILTNKKQLTSIPKNFYIEIPEEFSSEVQEGKPEDVLAISVEWTAKQCEELLNNGVPSLHFYIMLDSKPVEKS